MTQLLSHRDAVELALVCQRKLDEVTTDRERLLAAAESVVWFDWSGNDGDARAAIDRLNAAINAIRARGTT